MEHAKQTNLDQNQPTSVNHSSGANLTIAIILAIFVALVLIGLGFAAYQDENTVDQEESTNSQVNPDDSVYEASGFKVITP